MTQQLDLFDMPTKGMTHAGDPISSELAAERHVTSGARAKNKSLVLAVLKRQARIGGEDLTAGEISVSIHWDEMGQEYKQAAEVRRRLDDLFKDGVAEKSDNKCRVCRVLGTKTMTWKLK